VGTLVGDRGRSGDVIVAPATPPGVGALAIVRLSGPPRRGRGCPALAPSLPREPENRRALVCRFVDAGGRPVDEGIVLPFSPRTPRPARRSWSSTARRAGHRRGAPRGARPGGRPARRGGEFTAAPWRTASSISRRPRVSPGSPRRRAAPPRAGRWGSPTRPLAPCRRGARDAAGPPRGPRELSRLRGRRRGGGPRTPANGAFAGRGGARRARGPRRGAARAVSGCPRSRSRAAERREVDAVQRPRRLGPRDRDGAPRHHAGRRGRNRRTRRREGPPRRHGRPSRGLRRGGDARRRGREAGGRACRPRPPRRGRDRPPHPDDGATREALGAKVLVVRTKGDLPAAPGAAPGDVAVSARTGAGLEALKARVVERLGLAESGKGLLVLDRHRDALERAGAAVRAAARGGGGRARGGGAARRAARARRDHGRDGDGRAPRPDLLDVLYRKMTPGPEAGREGGAGREGPLRGRGRGGRARRLRGRARRGAGSAATRSSSRTIPEPSADEPATRRSGGSRRDRSSARSTPSAGRWASSRTGPPSSSRC